MNERDFKEQLARILSTARNKVGVSQRSMAKLIGKSFSTVQNWESGVSTPNLWDVIHWFDVLGVNPMRSFLNLQSPEIFDFLSASNNDDELKKSLLSYINGTASTDEIRKLCFCILGNTGSSWHAQLDMLTAHNHLPMQNRVVISRAIYDSYQMCKANDTLVCPENIAPDEKNLLHAIESGKDSASQGQNRYSGIQSSMNPSAKEDTKDSSHNP